MGRYTHYMTDCSLCGERTTRRFARKHNGHCKKCAGPEPQKPAPPPAPQQELFAQKRPRRVDKTNRRAL